jgi:hypothetical protein
METFEGAAVVSCGRRLIVGIAIDYIALSVVTV